MKKSPQQEGARWLAQAKADLSGANALLSAGHFHMACFSSQQVAEKAIKAFLYHQGEELVYGHSVLTLCDRAANFDAAFAAVKPEVKNLDQFYIEARYPNGLPDSIPAEFFDKTDAEWALQAATKVVDLVESIVRQK